MKKINKPSIRVSEVFEDCISNMNETAVKKELLNSVARIKNAEDVFDSKKTNNTLSTISHNEVISHTVDAKVLKSIYKDRMIKKDNPGRVHYNTIFESAPGGRCPLCSQRIVTTLDHYLPKYLYPMLSVAPLNLIPSCKDCNIGKLTDYPTQNTEETLHPYYDDVENFDWLAAKVTSSKPFAIEYFVATLNEWSDLLQKRVEHHFYSFQLNSLFTIHAVEEYENIKIQLTNIYNNGGTIELKKHLQDCFESRYAVNKNSWQTAFYRALKTSAEFCNGNFI